MQLKSVGKFDSFGLVQQTERQVMASGFWKQNEVAHADRYGGAQFLIIIAGLELILVQAGPVIQDTLAQMGTSEQLHFDIEYTTALIAGLDIKHRELVEIRFLRLKRIQDLHVLN